MTTSVFTQNHTTELNYPSSEFPHYLPVTDAACCWVQNSAGEILMCSRKGNPNDLGLPGGSVDPGETSFQAAVRELWEETGLRVNDMASLLDYLRQHPENIINVSGHSYVTTFIIPIEYLEGEVVQSNPEEDYITLWGSPELTYSEFCSFSEYNKLLHSLISFSK